MSLRTPVIAHHLILTCYGFWLPNDPRGSGSLKVWSQALRPFGPGTKVDTQRSVAAVAHDRQIRLAAKLALRHPPVRLTGHQAQAAADGFGRYIRDHGLTCVACGVMPDHAHFVVRQMFGSITRLAIALKAAAAHAMLEAGLHPYQDHDPARRPKVWARGDRHVYLFTQYDVDRSIRYVEGNPIRAGFKRQRWSFVERNHGTTASIKPRTK